MIAGGSSPMFSKDLEYSIGQCYKRAREARHEFITVEHLLLALLDNPSAAEVLRACGANLDDLRKSLTHFIDEHASSGCDTTRSDTQPTLGFQRVIQRAIMHVQSSRQEGSHRRQRAGRDLRREGLARRLLPAPAGRHAARRRQLHLARHHQEAAATEPQGQRGRGSERRRRRRRGQGRRRSTEFTRT